MIGHGLGSGMALFVLALIALAVWAIYQMALSFRRIMQLTRDMRRLARMQSLLRKVTQETITSAELNELAEHSQWLDRELAKVCSQLTPKETGQRDV